MGVTQNNNLHIRLIGVGQHRDTSASDVCGILGVRIRPQSNRLKS